MESVQAIKQAIDPLDSVGVQLRKTQAELEAQLSELDALIARRAEVQSQLSRVNGMLAQFKGEKPPAPKKPRKRRADAGTKRKSRAGANPEAIERATNGHAEEMPSPTDSVSP